jgi:hypothetical protein
MQLNSHTRRVIPHLSTIPLTLSRKCWPACVCFHLIALIRAPAVWLSGSTPCHANQRCVDLQAPPLHVLLNNEPFVLVNWHGLRCKGFLMHDWTPNGQTLSYCWVFVPPKEGQQYCIQFIPCCVVVAGGYWCVQMPHQPPLPIIVDANMPGLFLPRPPSHPPPAVTPSDAKKVRLILPGIFCW